MSYFERTFSIVDDTANAKFNLDSFLEEVASSIIVPGVHHANVLGDDVTIFFKADLSGAEDTTFLSLVAAHEGVDPEPDPQKVEFANKTPLGVSKIALVKADGNSETLVSHNFCDKNTWPAVDNSVWGVEPPVGFRYKLLKAEVQFSHDVLMQTLTPTPAELKSTIEYLGNAIPEHTRIFKNIMDVFDLGNKHYTMNATVDGIPGVTTVVFDYADAITLESAAQMKMVFESINHLELGGTHCTVAMVVTPEAYG